jgi:hypothetical protein
MFVLERPAIGIARMIDPARALPRRGVVTAVIEQEQERVRRVVRVAVGPVDGFVRPALALVFDDGAFGIASVANTPRP